MKRFLLLTLILCLLGGMNLSQIKAQTVVTIDGTVGGFADDYTVDVPFNSNYKYTTTQTFYYANELAGGIVDGYISSISYYVEKKLYTSGDVARTMKIYMANTTEDRYASNKITLVNEKDCVFDGTVTIDAQQKWITIELDTPFKYTGNNILLTTYDYTGNDLNKNTNFDAFKNNATDSNGKINRSLYKRGTSLYDPTSTTTTFSINTYIADVQFTFIASGGVVIPSPEFTDTYAYPYNNAENVFNPYLKFYVENATHYQVTLSANEDLSSPLYQTGWEATNDEKEITIIRDFGLTYNPATKYYWKVTARNGEDTDAPTAEKTYSFTTANVTTKPGDITNIEPADNADVTSNPTLSWTFGEYTLQYQVWFGFEGEEMYLEKDWTYINNATTASFGTNDIDLYKDQVYNDLGLESNTSYNWKVVTKNDNGETESEIFTFTKIGAPDDVTIISPAEGATGQYLPTLSWTFADNTEEYRVLIGESPATLAYFDPFKGGKWEKATGENGSYETYDYEFKPNTTYYWCVDVRNGAGSRGQYGCDESVEIHSFTTTDIIPAKYTTPTDGSLLNATSTTLFWSYGTGNNVKEYQVLFGTDGRRLEPIQDWTEASGTNGNFVIENLDENTTYYWQVNVRNENDVEREGEVWSFYSKLCSPKNLTAEDYNIYPGDTNTCSTKLMWDSIAEAKRYHVYVNGEKKWIDAESNEYTLSGLSYGEPYEVQVSAIYDYNEEERESDKTEAITIQVAGYAPFVSGSIANEINFENISGANVVFSGIDQFGEEVEYTCTTSNDGSYTLEYVLVGTYTMTVSKDHYVEKSEEFEFEHKKTYRNIYMDLYPVIPDNVTDIAPENEATKQYNPELSWTFAENTTHYRLLMSEDIDALVYKAGSATEWLEAGTTATFQTSNLTANTTYYWCVDVKNANVPAGERTFYNQYDINPEIFSFTTTDEVPVKNNTPANGVLAGNTTVDLTWIYGSGNNVTNYRVYLGTDENNMSAVTRWSTRASESTGLASSGSYTASNLKANTKYYWRIDVRKGSDGNIIQGEVWSFVTTLDIPQNIAANPVEVYPTSDYQYKKGVTTITWDAIDGASYNIYANGEQQNEEAITTSSYDLPLGYNMDSIGHSIQVTALYEELGESEKSVAANVKVIGYATIYGTVTDHNNAPLEGAAVTLFGTDLFGNEQEIAFNDTDENGAYSGRVPDGEYNIVIEKTPYNEHISKLATYTHEESTTYNVQLSGDFIFEVRFKDVTVDQLPIYLANDKDWDVAKIGNYNVYIKQGEDILLTKTAWFSEVQQGATAVYNTSDFNDIWFNLENGTYEIGAEIPGTDYINWTSIERNYSIFLTDGNWSEASNWRGVPGTDAEVYIYAKATIEAENDVTVKSVTIQRNCSLTINGSLKADKVNNEFGVANLVINDGGQLRQTGNNDLKGRFVMNIDNPTDWDNAIDGWQFISSPIVEAKIENFVPNALYFDYDLYKYDGSKIDAEWVNQKMDDEESEQGISNFETTFKLGRGYLASYQEDPLGEKESKAVFSGTFNSTTTFNYELAYSETNDLAKFNLLGNPFTFDMNIASLNANGLTAGVAVIDETGSGYKYLTEGEIKVGQGFFVKANSATATLSYSDGTRARENKAASLNITASNKTNSDNVIVRFAGAEKDGFNKLENFDKEIAEIYVINNGRRYAIMSYDENVQEIGLNFDAKKMGNYTISIEPNGEFESVILVDRFTGVETDMLLEDYTFTATSNDDNNRFVVRLSVNGQQTTDNKHFAYQSGDELIISAEGSVQIVDMLGRLVYSSDVESANNRINVSGLDKASYIVRVVNNNEVKVQKVVIY